MVARAPGLDLGKEMKALLVWQEAPVLSAPGHRVPQAASPSGSDPAQALFTLGHSTPCTLWFGYFLWLWHISQRTMILRVVSCKIDR